MRSMSPSMHRFGDATAALLDPRVPLPALRARGGASPERRWSVHRATAVGGLVDTLATAFPVARQIVGDEFFDAMSRRFVVQSPPRSPVLDEYGDDYPAFVDGFAPAGDVPYLADVMRLERLHVRVARAADAAPLDLAAFQGLLSDPSRLLESRIQLHPACGWLRSSHPVAALWQAHPAGADVDSDALAAIDLTHAQDVLVARPDLDIQVAVLPHGALEMFDALRAGATLGCAFARAHANTAELAPAVLFTLMLRHGLAVALEP